MLSKSVDYRLHQIALLGAGIGALVGIGATIFAWLTSGDFSSGTFWGSLFAITAAAPVWRKYRNMTE